MADHGIERVIGILDFLDIDLCFLTSRDRIRHDIARCSRLVFRYKAALRTKMQDFRAINPIRVLFGQQMMLPVALNRTALRARSVKTEWHSYRVEEPLVSTNRTLALVAPVKLAENLEHPAIARKAVSDRDRNISSQFISELSVHSPQPKLLPLVHKLLNRSMIRARAIGVETHKSLIFVDYCCQHKSIVDGTRAGASRTRTNRVVGLGTAIRGLRRNKLLSRHPCRKSVVSEAILAA